LIGRIGVGRPFQVGARRTLHVARDGELFLGVNDNYLADNSGTWSVAIALSASTTSPPTAPSRTSPAIVPAKHGAGGTALVLLVLLLSAVLVAAVVCWRIYAGRHRRQEAAEPFASGNARTATGEASRSAIPTVPPPAARAAGVAEADTGFVDVNIFQVELVDGCALRVGYNYFPEGTVVSWRVSQRRATRATGEFVTNGGGSTYHFVTAPFETRLPTDSDAADVLFTWTIGDVPFRYSVKRDPG
jgi:hypothetical protein